MRNFTLLALLTTLLTAPVADARLFWQTYGSTTPAPGECDGSAWNLNQDYFVPRHCDTGRYGLFSSCKTTHTRSAACRNLHPVYDGYCTPYGACRYRWRDHVYKTYFGCTPLAHDDGPWRTERCGKGCLALRHGGAPCGGAGCRCEGMAYGGVDGYESFDVEALPDVEPFGGEILGTVAALPSGSLGGGGATPGLRAAGASTPRLPLPQFGGSPPLGSSENLPAPFTY